MTQAIDADEAEYRQRLQRALGNDFELRDLIGRGGFGSVYAAWDRKLEREVAVKALRHDLFPTRLVLERFQREAKAVAKLRHAHILPVYAVGEGEGVAYMVMPVIHGENLRTTLASKTRIDPVTTVGIVSDMARALGAAHRLGIIHRDVKPENILLEGDERHALLTDFGIAKSADAEGGLTGSGVVMGSPLYMSPEQASADRELDGRSDIYSLGAVAYEMLAGRRPYEANTLQQQLVLQFTTEPAPLADVAPEVPGPLGGAVMRALARDPANRWQTAAEFAAALDAAVLADAASATTPSSWFARRGPMLAVAYFVGIYTSIFAMALRAGQKIPAIELAVSVLATPLSAIASVAIVLMLLELAITIVLQRRSGASWREVRLRAFGQPSWWQAWYPRSLRDPENVWDRMPLSVRVIRTIIWVNLVLGAFAIPMIFAGPILAPYAAGLNAALPLPMRIVLQAADLVLGPLFYLQLLALVGILVLAWRRRVSIPSVLALLFTWRARPWDSSAGQRLMRGGEETVA